MTELSKRLMATGCIEWRPGMKRLGDYWHDAFVVGDEELCGFFTDGEWDIPYLIGRPSDDDIPDLSHAGTWALCLEQLEEHLDGPVSLVWNRRDEPFWHATFRLTGDERVHRVLANNKAKLLVKIAEALGEP